MSTLDYIDSFYRRTLIAHKSYMCLEHNEQADIVVIGGGFAGLTCAIELLKRGRNVTLLEANRVGWGASGRNGGSVSPAWSANASNILKRVGPDQYEQLYRLSIEGVKIVEEYATQLAPEACNLVYGHLKVSLHENSDAFKSFCEDQNRKYGRNLQYLERNQVQELLNSPRYHQGVYSPDGFHFHPLNYCHALAAECSKLGANIYELTPAQSIESSALGYKVITPMGTITASEVVICTGGYTNNLVPALKKSFLPISTYIMLSEPLDGRLQEAIRTTAAIGDTRRAGNYYRIVDGNRLQWGGHITTQTSDPDNIKQVLHKELALCYPQLKDIPIAITWSGLMSYARHMMPQVGMLKPGLWYCTAFGGHGANTTSIGARTVAEAITKQSDRYKLFAPFGLAWNGGLFGKAAVQLTYWRYQVQDKLKEKFS